MKRNSYIRLCSALLLIALTGLWSSCKDQKRYSSSNFAAFMTNEGYCNRSVAADDSYPKCESSSLKAIHYGTNTYAYGTAAKKLCNTICSQMWVARDGPTGLNEPAGSEFSEADDCAVGNSDILDNSQHYLPDMYVGKGLEIQFQDNSLSQFSICACGESNAHRYKREQGLFTSGEYVHCYNAIQDCGESSTDCGGGGCGPCEGYGASCTSSADCAGGVTCTFSKRDSDHEFGGCGEPSDKQLCNNGQKDGLETDIDCGGGTCPACGLRAVESPVPCNSDECTICNSTCTRSLVTKAYVNTGLDSSVNCNSPVCTACETCSNSLEIVVPQLDCSNPTCALCEFHCVNGVNKPNDRWQGCSGPDCLACESAMCQDGQHCVLNADCASNNCKFPPGTGSVLTQYGGCNKVYQSFAIACSNGIRDNEETGVDCGGGCPNGCPYETYCLADSDCQTGCGCPESVCIPDCVIYQTCTPVAGLQCNGCQAGQVSCDGTCTDLQTDENNCGACGHQCPYSQCISGACGPCQETQCGSTCVNTQTDPNNCGQCGYLCAANGWCSGGSCLSCASGYTGCPNGGCTVLAQDPNNCGKCGNQCTGNTPYCSNGSCVANCPAGTTGCCTDFQNGCNTAGYGCSNTLSDPNNCGECGSQCGNSCQDGSCQ